jgi:hypothetical protein
MQKGKLLRMEPSYEMKKIEYKKNRQTKVSKCPCRVVWLVGWSRLAPSRSWCLPLRKAPGRG